MHEQFLLKLLDRACFQPLAVKQVMILKRLTGAALITQLSTAKNATHNAEEFVYLTFSAYTVKKHPFIRKTPIILPNSP